MLFQPKISEEARQKIREAVLNGASRYSLAKEFGVSYPTICRATTDLPAKGRRKLSEEKKESIRQAVMNGMSKYQAAKEFGVCLPTAYNLTKDLPSKRGGNRNIGDQSVKILQAIFKDGYFIPPKGHVCLGYYRTIQMRFPVKIVVFKNMTVYFLEDRREEALKGFIKRGGRVMQYNQLVELSRLFGVGLDYKMRKELISKMDESKLANRRKLELRKQGTNSQPTQDLGFVSKFIL